MIRSPIEKMNSSRPKKAAAVWFNVDPSSQVA
jgi:hypothetical protein